MYENNKSYENNISIDTHQKLSNDYWSSRAKEFSALRLSEYNSIIGQRLKDYISKEIYTLCQKKKCASKDLQVLDLGTGAGLFAIIFRELGCRVSAVDFSKEMLDEAKDNCKSFKFDDINFILSDIKNLDFDNNSFDIVWTRNVTWIVPCVESLYKEIYRLLKIGGEFINLDANYGKMFRNTLIKGEVSTHVTQNAQQLMLRNKLAAYMAISYCDRPLWDRAILHEIGYKNISTIDNLYDELNIEKENIDFIKMKKEENCPLFAIKAEK